MRLDPAWSTSLTILAVAQTLLFGSVPAHGGTIDPTPTATILDGQQTPDQGPVDPSRAGIRESAPPTPPDDSPGSPPTELPLTELPTEQPPDPGIPTPAPEPTTPSPVPAPAPKGESLPVGPTPVNSAPDPDATPLPPTTAPSPASTDRVTSAPVADVPPKPVQLSPMPPAGGGVVESAAPRAVPPSAVQRGSNPRRAPISNQYLPFNGSPAEQVPAPTVDADPAPQPISETASPEQGPDTRDVVIAALSIFAIIIAIAIAVVSGGHRKPTLR